MLVDLLSSTNQISFNIVVAKTFGLHAAIYLSELMSILEKAIRKEKIEVIDEKQYFTINRKYIADRTTILPKEQKDLDARLSDINIIKIKKDAADTLYLDIDLLAAMLGTTINTEIVKDLGKIVKKKSKEEAAADKLENIRNMAQKSVITTNPELRTAFYSWIDSVLNRYNTINKATVTNNEKLVNEFSKRNLDIALEIVNKTAITGYNNMQYAIDDYINKHPKYMVETTIQKELPKTVVLGSEEF